MTDAPCGEGSCTGRLERGDRTNRGIRPIRAILVRRGRSGWPAAAPRGESEGSGAEHRGVGGGPAPLLAAPLLCARSPEPGLISGVRENQAGASPVFVLGSCAQNQGKGIADAAVAVSCKVELLRNGCFGCGVSKLAREARDAPPSRRFDALWLGERAEREIRAHGAALDEMRRRKNRFAAELSG